MLTGILTFEGPGKIRCGGVEFVFVQLLCPGKRKLKVAPRYAGKVPVALGPIQFMSKEKVSGPFTVAGDCKGVGRANVVGDLVMFVGTQEEHVPEGGVELRVEDVAM
jgi:hypothetical protein